MAAALHCRLGIVVMDERTRKAWGFIPRDAPLDKVAVVSLKRRHFTPCRGFVDVEHLEFHDDVAGGGVVEIRGGRSQLKESTVSTANVTSWRSGVDQLSAWKGSEERPHLCAMQEIAAWPNELPTAQARFRAEGYSLHAVPSIPGPGGGRSAGVAVAVRSHLPSASFPLGVSLLSGRLVGITVNAWLRHGVDVYS
eukprot:4706839-Amphidinium_carterae.1